MLVPAGSVLVVVSTVAVHTQFFIHPTSHSFITLGLRTQVPYQVHVYKEMTAHRNIFYCDKNELDECFGLGLLITSLKSLSPP